MKSELIFQSSAWFILLCLLVGAIYAFVLYQKKNTFSTLQNRLLAIFRGLLVSLVAFLLLNPLLRSNKISTEKPTVVFAVDNSSSMNASGTTKLAELKTNLAKLQESVETAGLSIEVQSLSDNKSLDSIKFQEKQTNLSELLANIKNNYEGRNLTDVVLISDGIVNAGISPTYGKYNFNIHAVAIGDTTSKKDIKINAVYANRIAYLGNKFPLQVDISSFGFQGKNTTVFLKQNGKILEKQVVSFSKNDDLKSLTFYATSTQKGMQRYTIEVVPLGGEFSIKNNSRDSYIDIVDGKEKILLVAFAPHPDIKAIKAIVDKNDLYELEVKILQNTENINEIKPFDVLILHQLSDKAGIGNMLVSKLLAANKPTFFILGNQANTLYINTFQQAISINAPSGQIDKVSAKFNPAFKLFNLDADKLNILEKLPPLQVPYGDYKTLAGSDVILYQKIGAVNTPKPLLAVNTSTARKTAILAGEGLWQWRLEEFSLTDKQEVVDDLLLKTIQLISVKDDKRKLRIYPTSPEFSIGEKVVFENESYNDIFERIYDQAIKLAITDENGKLRNYTYTTSKDNTHFEISDLPQGVYRYNASTSILGKSETVSGQFVVKDTDLEQQNTTADFNLLRTLASKNNGKFLIYNDLAKLKEILLANKSKDKISSIEEMNELINWKILFFIILLLATLEWGIRKYLGTY